MTGGLRSARRRLLAGAVLALLVTGCGKRDAPTSGSDSDQPVDHANWVKIYDPSRAFNGYTLALHHARIPVLLDMNGRRVHSWPEARVKSRVKLLPDGSILALALGRSVVEYDWEGRETWRYVTEPHLPHHDVIRLDNGNTMFLILPENGGADEILEVDRAGEIVWRWRAIEHLTDFISEEHLKAKGLDLTHINSLAELPDNPWYSTGDERFRPGNLLLSARNLNLVFVIDRQTGDVTWSYGDKLDLQHEALMISQGSPGAGNILLFDNGSRQTYRYRQSRIVEIEPRSNEVVWEYSSEDFYSTTAGIQQPLPNGNVLIGSSRGGRVFEIDRGGSTVWQWTPPFEPVRPSRYSWNYTPQLAARGKPQGTEVVPAVHYRHVDWPIYRFTFMQLREERLEEQLQKVQPVNNACNLLLLPGKPHLWTSYGVSRSRALTSGKTGYAAEFSLRYRLRDSEEWTDLIADPVDLEGYRWFERAFDLDALEHEWAEICIATREIGAADDEPTEPFAFWNGPWISSRSREKQKEVGNALGDLTGDELEVRRKHLEALGYVN